MKAAKCLSIVILLCGLALVACGPSQEELDATATQEAVDSAATQTAAAPTTTPRPTDMPTPTPPAPEAEALMADAQAAMSQLESLHMDMDMAASVSQEGVSMEIPIIFAADVDQSGNVQGTMSITILDMAIEIEMINLDGVTYTTDPTTGQWSIVPEEESPLPFDPEALVAPEAGGSGLGDLTFIGQETLEGVDVYHLQGTLPADAFAAAGEGADVTDLPAEIWVGVEDDLIYQLTFSGTLTIASLEELAAGGGEMTMDVTIAFSNFNEPLEIIAPEITAAFEVISGVRGALALAYMPNGLGLATGGDDAIVRVWHLDYPGSQPVELTGPTDAIRGLAFSPDGRLLAAAGDEQIVWTWDVVTARQVQLDGHTGRIRALAFSPDGSTLASAGDDTTILLWDTTDLQAEPQRLEGHSDHVRALAFSPSGGALASGGDDLVVLLWDMNDLAAPPVELAGHEDWVRALAFSPDSTTLASGSDDSLIYLWSVDDPAAQPQALEGHADAVNALAYSPDGGALASGDDGGVLLLWDLSDPTAAPRGLAGHSGSIAALAFNPDGGTLASAGSNAVFLWDLTADEPVAKPLGAAMPPCIPSLISPSSGAILDNGRIDKTDSIVWEFDWSDCPGATEYHLYVIGDTAIYPIINDITITQSSYDLFSQASYIVDRNRFNWTWKVRAKVGGLWGGWSETRVFDVEPLDTDPSSTALYVKSDGNSRTCDSWENACSLQTALVVATAGDEIWVAAGIYKPAADTSFPDATFPLKEGVALYGGFAGTETARDQRDWETHVTVLSGDLGGDDTTDPNGVVTDTANIVGQNAYHVVNGSGVDKTAVLDGFVITAGYASQKPPNIHGFGGGMFMQAGSPTLNNLVFSGNTAGKGEAYYGGGAMYISFASNPVLTHVTFIANTAGGAAGMFNDRGSNPVLNDVVFSGNKAIDASCMGNYTSSSPVLNGVVFDSNSSSNKGCMVNHENSNPILTDVTFSNNSARYGSGMYNGKSSPTLTDVVFSNNVAGHVGGAMENEDHSNPILNNVLFSGNSAYHEGGGMFNIVGSNPILTNIAFINNQVSGDGGGGGMRNANSSPILLNVTFSGNHAVVGGGIDNWQSSLALMNVTFSENTADRYGSAMYSQESTLTITNTIIWGNTPRGSQMLNDRGVSTVTYSIIAGDHPGTGNLNVNPKLGTLEDNGGFTPTYSLLLGSPAIDTGSLSSCPTMDQRDIPRLEDGDGDGSAICDIGAFEYRTPD